MDFSKFWLQSNNGKEQIGEIKQGIRREQIDAKLQNLFDAYDTNKDGTLETEELDGIFKGLQRFAGSDRVFDTNENTQVKSIFAKQLNIQDADFQGFVKSVSEASAAIHSSSEKQTPDGGKEVTTTYKDGTVETISYYPDGELKFKKTIKNSVSVLFGTQKPEASQALGNTPTVTVIASKKARAKIPNIENAIKELIEDGKAAADVAKKYKIDKNMLVEYYNSLLAPVSDDMLTFYGDEATFKKLREQVANNTEITVATLNNDNPDKKVTIVSHNTKNGGFYRAYDKYGDAITSQDLHDVFGITDVRSTEDGAFRFVTDNSGSVEVSQAATRQGNAVIYNTTLKDYLDNQAPKVSVAVSKKVAPVEFSQRAESEIEIKQSILQHFVDSRQEVQEYLKTMGVLDNLGASINEVFGGKIFELLKKYQNTASQALKLDAAKSQMNADKALYLNNFEETTGLKASTETCTKFYNTILQYQNATILKERLNILKEAMHEVKQYKVDQGLSLNSPGTSEGIKSGAHIDKANKLLLQYFGGDQEAVNMLLDGAMNENNSKVVQAIHDLYTETQKMNEAVLGGKKYDDVKSDYQNQYKAMYGTDFVPDNLTDKVMDAKATGSFVKLAAITIISILITRSPAMAQINGAIAGSAEATGAAANLMRTLVAKYGQAAVQQAVKFGMTTGTLATDVGLTLMNQVTSERGVNGEELWESTKASAKFIYFGAYVGGPLAQAVSKQLGKIGATAKMFEGGVKSANGVMQTTTIAGDKLMQNLAKGGNQVLTKGGAFLTDVAAFTGLEVVTDGQDLATAGKEQLEFLPKLKIMNGIIEYMLGGRVHAGMVKAKMDAAIEQSGVKNWTIKEIKTPTKTIYEVEVGEGMPKARFANSNDLATAMAEAVAGKYEKVKDLYKNNSLAVGSSIESIKEKTSYQKINGGIKDFTIDDVRELFSNTNGELRSNRYTNTIFDEMPWDLREWCNNNPRQAYQHLERNLGFSKIISEDVYSAITKVLNSNNGKYKQLLTENSENALGMRNIDALATVLMYAEHKGTLNTYINAIEKNPQIIDIVLPGIIDIKKEAQAYAITNYKGSSNPINESLSLIYSPSFSEKFPAKKAQRSFAKNPDIPDHINNLTSYLSEHPLQADAVLYRAEQYNGVLGNLKFDLYDANGNIIKSGTNLSDELKNIVYEERKKLAQNRGCSVDNITIDDVRAAGITITPENCSELQQILKSLKVQKASVTQERFTSTTLDVGVATHWADAAPMDGGKGNPDGSIIYVYNCQKGTEAAFVNNYDVMSNGMEYGSTKTQAEYSDEIEILIQRSSVQIPVNLEFRNGHWMITTDIQTNGKNLEKIRKNML